MNSREYTVLWNKIIMFVDDFRLNPQQNFIKTSLDSLQADALYAGVVEYLAREQQVTIPDWVFDRKYYLDEPWFVSGLKNLHHRIITMIECPGEFKSRNIFLGKNTFDRC